MERRHREACGASLRPAVHGDARVKHLADISGKNVREALINERSGYDYEPLWAELKRLKAHRVQYSLWLVNLSYTAEQVVNHFKKFVDKDDRLWASQVREAEHWFVNAKGGTNAWLKENPPT